MFWVGGILALYTVGINISHKLLTMDETVTVNSQPNEEAEIKSAPIDPKLLAAVVALLLVALLVVVTFTMKMSQDEGVLPIVPVEETAEVQPEVVQVPANFPADVAIEEGAVLEQGYTLAVADNEQNTVVFTSAKSAKEVYAAYKDQLEKDRWILIADNESDTVSSLYGLRRSDEINVTIVSQKDGGSEVSISVVTK
jgi:hypothetical protein